MESLKEAAKKICKELDLQIIAFKSLPPKNKREYVDKRMDKVGHLVGGVEAARDFIYNTYVKGEHNE